jgi:hypothetical protein
MPKLVTAILCRNEAGKYLERVIRRCADFSDEICLLDDGSTDGSDRLAWRLGCGVKRRKEPGMWGNESPARAELWDWASRIAEDGWVLICDADMLLHGDPRPLTYSTTVNSWAWPLWDCWNAERYFRCDGYWQGHLHPRIWMVKPSALKDIPKWPERGLHTGHFPTNFPYVVGNPNRDLAKPDLAWLHLAYVDPEHRRLKLEQYLAKAEQLTPFELDHARSVGD